ncbi:MAG: hypothetical protein KTR30_06340 [Saprospiraceae bacterium]|nr:hypothetical protein [Saprospiraceae bacterium]
MEAKLKAIEKQIKRTHHFAWSPKHIEKIKIDMKPRLAIHLAEQVFEELEWEIVYQSHTEAEAYYLDRFNFRREKVSVTATSYGQLEVKSESTRNEMWDQGRNSKRVRLFLHAFQKLAEQQDNNSLKTMTADIERKEKWEDYEEPDDFPLPPESHRNTSTWAIIYGGLAAILLSGVWAFATVNDFYVLLLFEVLIAFALAKTLSAGFERGNFTYFIGVQWILAGCVMLLAALYHYFQYLFIVKTGDYLALSLWDLYEQRLAQGLMIKDLNLGAPGWMILLALQPVLIYIIALSIISRSQLQLLIDRVPMPVIDHAYYHFLQGKSETQVRGELSKKGWKDKGVQDMVFEAMSAISDSMELNRE